MKTKQEVSTNKLRGGFYTPQSLVDVCLDRVVKLSEGQDSLSVLEPSVGDGAFLRHLVSHPFSARVQKFLGIEIVESEAYKCRQIAQTAPFDVNVLNVSVLDWATKTEEYFDVVLGNPPFVRFQFVSDSDIHATTKLGQRLNLPFRRIGNLWIPVLLGALSRLRPGGFMALVVPAEIFTGLSAGDVRAWLLAKFDLLRVDMFEPGSFPDVLQEVVIISGRRRHMSKYDFERSNVEFSEHMRPKLELRWAHCIPHGAENWTRYFLTPTQLSRLTEAQNLPGMQCFGKIAKLEVSIVTGANDFFSVNAEELKRFQLQAWAEPLLPRIRHAEGLIYNHTDHKMTIASGAKAWLLNFSEDNPDPRNSPGAARYLDIGKLSGLDTRYKTSIRTPWYRVPWIEPGKLLLSKRSHWFPRFLYNEAGVVTTDTIYRGRILPPYDGRELDLVTVFHNSLTLLTAEIEGRSFGGGVLELVPSEIARLTIPFPSNRLSDALPYLDQIARAAATDRAGQEQLIEETNSLLCKNILGLTNNLMGEIEQTRRVLLQRRLSRN